MKTLFTDEEKERIRAAVAEAEQRTSGEIVPYIVSKSGLYYVSAWRAACFSALLAILIVLSIFQLYEGWGLGWLHTGWGTSLVILAAGTTGALLGAYVNPLKRLFAGNKLMTWRVHARAMIAFVEEEVFNTRDRTGILLFISLFEHRIEVIGDTGINQKVTTEDWVHIVDCIREGIKEGRLADGLVEGIKMCGDLLEKSGVAIRSDDINELSDSVRLRKG